MQVSIKVTGWYRRYTSGVTELDVQIKEGEPIGAILCRIGIPEDEIGFITSDQSFSGGRFQVVEKSHILVEGEHIKVFPLILGG